MVVKKCKSNMDVKPGYPLAHWYAVDKEENQVGRGYGDA